MRRRNALSTQSTFDLAIIAAIGIGVLWLISKVKAPAAAATNALATGIANFWNTLTMSAPISVTGSVDLPGGGVAAISSLSWKTDNQGNSYTMVGGTLYQMAARGPDGNFTLVAVNSVPSAYTGITSATAAPTGATGATSPNVTGMTGATGATY